MSETDLLQAIREADAAILAAHCSTKALDREESHEQHWRRIAEANRHLRDLYTRVLQVEPYDSLAYFAAARLVNVYGMEAEDAARKAERYADLPPVQGSDPVPAATETTKGDA